jgi:hypothetical protein
MSLVKTLNPASRVFILSKLLCALALPAHTYR